MTSIDAGTRRRGLPAGARRFLRTPSAAIAALCIGLIVLIALAAPLVFRDVDAVDAANRLLAPSPQHPFGTDELGRDLTAKLAHAARLTLGISLGAMVVSVLLGLLWGMIAAAFGGIVDDILMRIADAVMAVPMILLALVFVAALGASPPILVLILGLIKAPLAARVIRSATLVELASDYVRGLTVVGLSRPRILFGEVLPNVFPIIAAQATLNAASAMMVEASLSFVGLGVQPPEASWGTLLKLGYGYLHEAWWYPLGPAVAIVILIASFNAVGQQLQRSLDRRSA